jgi:hypothetical protein
LIALLIENPSESGCEMVFRPLRFLGRYGKAGAALLGVLAMPAGLAAEPLDKDACGKLVTEKQGLVVLGVEKEFAKGPDWAKANLPQDELDKLKRYLAIEEQLKFRCGMAVVTLHVPDEPEEGDDDDGAPSTGSVPMPQRRDTTDAVKPAAKQVTIVPKSQPGAIAKPAKTVPKPAAAKAQSSWNAETMPLGGGAPAATAPVGTTPKTEKHKPTQTGDQG